MMKMKKILRNNYKLLLVCLLIATIGHSYFLKNQILNDQYMIGPYDQFSQMLIFKDFLYDEFSRGNFFYSFNFNGGGNFFTRLSYYFSTSIVFYLTALITYIFEVFNILSSTSILYWASVAVVISIARTIVILFVTTKYIDIFIRNKKISILGATFYALSSIYFRHATLWEFFGDAMIWLPVLLMGVEFILRRKNGKIFAIGIALTMFNNGYFAFANLLFTLIYIILRAIFKLSPEEPNLFKQIKNYLIYGLLGVGVSLPGFVPFAIGFFRTSRLSPEFVLPTMEFIEFNLGNLLLNDRIQLLPILYIIIVSYFLNYKSVKFRFFSLLSFVLIVLRYNPFTASLFNGLSYPQYRWHYITFLIMAIVISIGVKQMVKELESNTKYGLISLGISALLTIGSYYVANSQVNRHYFNMKLLYFMILLSYLGFILMTFKSTKFKKNLLPMLFVASLYTIFVTNRQLYYDYNLHTMNYEKIYSTFDNPETNFEKALDIIEEDSTRFHRIDYSDMDNYATQKRFSSFNIYTSFQNKYQQNFYRYFQIINSKENNGVINGLAGRQAMSSIFQSDYVIVPEADKYIIPTGFKEIGQVENLKVLKNQIPLAFIHPVQTLYSEDSVDYNDFKDNLLINGAIVSDQISNMDFNNEHQGVKRLDYEITEVGSETVGNKISSSETYFEIVIELQNDDKVYDDLVIDYTIKPDDTGEKGRYTYSINDYSIQLKSTGDPYSSQLYRHQAHIPYKEDIKFKLAPGTGYEFEIHSIYGVSNDELLERSIQDLELEYDVQLNGGKVDIRFNNKEDYPLMVLPIFYEDGWELKINGESYEVLNVNNGMVGFEIPSGEMNIQLKFNQPLLLETMLISVGSLSFLIYLDSKKD